MNADKLKADRNAKDSMSFDLIPDESGDVNWKIRRNPAAAYWIAECRKTEWPSVNEAAPELRIADLFSGCGGLSLGALIACGQLGRRLRIALAADSWSDALGVYKKNFGFQLETAITDDLSLMVKQPGSVFLSPWGRRLADSVGGVEIVLAGPPCQGHSDLNNSSRRDDPRNFLYTVPVAFALQKRSRILIIENVPTVIHAAGNVVSSAVETLGAHGYSVVEFVADAQDFGLPQTRKRHVLIASRVHATEELNGLLQLISRRRQDVPLWDFVEDLELESEDAHDLLTRRSKISVENQARINYLFDSDNYDLPNRLRPACHRDKEHSYVSMYGRLRPDLPSQTITSGFGSMGQGRFVHPTQRRMITSHEAARIQGFPDYFKFSSVEKVTSLRAIIGNAVAPPVAAVLLTLLLSSIPAGAMARNAGQPKGTALAAREH